MIYPNEIILPTLTSAFTNIPGPVPQFSFNDTTGATWGRMNPPQDFAVVGGLPTFFTTNYGNNVEWAYQFDGTRIWAHRLGKMATNARHGPRCYYGDDVLSPDEHYTKNLHFMSYRFFPCYANFPLPLPNGVSYATVGYQSDIDENICFPQGGVSCHTTNGSSFPGPVYGLNYVLAWIFNSSAPCSGSSNWGMTKLPWIGGNDNFYSTSNGSGSGTPPFNRQPGINDCLRQANEFNSCYMGGNLVACLVDNGQYAQCGTLLRVYRYIDVSYTPGYNPCSGYINVALQLIYERDLRDIFGYGSYYNCGSIWSNQKGLLAIVFNRNNYRRYVYMQFPGPVIIPVNETPMDTGGPSSNQRCFLMPDGRPGYCRVSTSNGNTRIRVSPLTIDFNMSIKHTPQAQSNAVYASNIVENLRS